MFTIRQSIDEKLYNLLVTRLDGFRLNSEAYRASIIELVKKGIGGLIVFGGVLDEVKSFIGELQGISGDRLIIASDVERGVGQQIQGATKFPCQMAMAAAISRDIPAEVTLIKSAVEAIASESIDVGINMPLIPVMDVNRNRNNPIICTRAFSDDPKIVASMGSLFVEVLERMGLLSCVKHFPGHGDTSTDSHITVPVITKTEEELFDVDIFPFAEAIKSGTSSVMVGHLCVPALDDLLLSTISPAIIKGLLREKLGFNGLIVTDALNMDALKAIGNVAAKCLNAGVDILLHPMVADQTVAELRSALISGFLGENTVESALERLGRFKAHLAQMANPVEKTRPAQPGKRRATCYEKHRAIAREIMEKSITLVKGEGFSLQGTRRLILSGESKYCESSPLTDFFENCSNIRDDVADAAGKSVVVAVFTSVAAWRGSSGLPLSDIDIVRGIINRASHSIVISFGSPYVLDHFCDADVLVAAYDETFEVQSAVIRCLMGEIPFRGRLPIAPAIKMELPKSNCL
ncbi:MAG: hypothetical protein HQK89_10610 [Nitrospirae bacterium]|nr:hypothetical protein [Nitrospirota bacterium]